MQLADQLTRANLSVFPCWDNKAPAIPGGFLAASITPGDYWPSELIGLPIPPGVLIIDVDTHKGMTLELIEQALQCAPDWQAALLQYTPSGGAHYAFNIQADMRQGSDLFADTIGKGFDTRVPGRGYICTGGGYQPDEPIGLFKLASPTCLPPLPLPAIDALSVQSDVQHEPTPLPDGDKNTAEVQGMLSALDASCSRSDWLRNALALKHHYHDDDDTGWLLFNNWSMTGGDAYDPVEAHKLWTTISPVPKEGAAPVTLATLAYEAMRSGYAPSSVAAAAFGFTDTTDSAPLTNIESLIATINADGGNPQNLASLTETISNTICSSIQRSALIATLDRTLRDHNLKFPLVELRKACAHSSGSTTAPVTQPLADYQPFPSLPVAPVNGLGNVHIANAGMMRQAVFGERLARFGSELHWWTGINWSSVSKSDLTSRIAHAFVGNEYGKTSNIDGTERQVRNMAPLHDELDPVSHRLYFRNGVLDTSTDNPLTPHNPGYFNSSTLGIDYDPTATHPNWTAFLHSLFEDEPTRGLLLQEIMGWWLINDNLGHQKAVALDGASRSGKGTVLAVANAILGRGMSDISLAQLTDNKSLGSLRSAQLAVDRDAKRPRTHDISTVQSNFNKITANEPIQTPLLYIQEPWVGTLNCKLAIACNGIPVMSDDSGAVPGRWLVVKFTRSFLGREDLTLQSRLVAEAPGICNWALEGLRRLMAKGTFTMPLSSIEESHALTDISSPLLQFADDRLEVDGEYRTHGDTLWDSYKQWCRDTNNYLSNRNQFIRSLERSLQHKGVAYHKSMRIDDKVSSGLSGIKLAPATLGLPPTDSVH